jgi:hypothetical protein
MSNEIPVDSPTRRSRLSENDGVRDLAPWRRAESLTTCFLAWMPVSTFPPGNGEREWLLHFTTLLGARLKASFQAEPYVFLQYKTAVTVHDEFVRHAQEFMPLMGLGRRPGSDIPDMPTEAELQAAIDQKRPLDVNRYTADYAYWFLAKSEAAQRKLFQGLGGLTIVYRKPDEKTKPPEITIPPKYRGHELFQQFDVPALLAGACSMRDEFLAKSKVAFGGGMKKTAQVEFIPFILPLFNAADIFALKEQDMKAAFELFDVYFHESPADGGILLASKHNLEKMLNEILAEMRQTRAEAAMDGRR